MHLWWKSGSQQNQRSCYLNGAHSLVQGAEIGSVITFHLVRGGFIQKYAGEAPGRAKRMHSFYVMIWAHEPRPSVSAEILVARLSPYFSKPRWSDNFQDSGEGLLQTQSPVGNVGVEMEQTEWREWIRGGKKKRAVQKQEQGSYKLARVDLNFEVRE